MIFYCIIFLILIIFYTENKIYIAGFALILFLIAIFRSDSVGTDYNSYIKNFIDIKNQFANYNYKTLINYFSVNNSLYGSVEKQMEPLWVLLNYIIFIIKGNYYIVNAISLILILALYIKVILKKSRYPSLSFFLFYALYYYFISYNTIRQGIAISFILLFYSYYEDKKYSRSLFALIIAILFHYSAIFALISIIIIKINIKNNLSYAFLIISLVFGKDISELIINKLFFSTIYLGYSKAKWGNIDYLISMVNYSIQIAIYYFVTVGNQKKDIYVKIWYFGLLLQNIFLGYIFFYRIADYFLVAQIIAIPNIYKKKVISNFRVNKKALLAIIMITISFLYNLKFNKQGIVPYFISIIKY